MDHTDRSKFIRRHRHDIESNLVVFEGALFDEHSLLLSKSSFECLHPLEYVAMTRGELVSSAQPDQVNDLFLVLLVRCFK